MEEIKTNIDCMKEKLNFICGMREGVQNLREEISKISETLSRKVDILESAIFSLQQDKDKLSEEVQQVKKENTSLRSQMEAGRKENRDLRAVQNDNEQHGQLWNVRVQVSGRGHGLQRRRTTMNIPCGRVWVGGGVGVSFTMCASLDPAKISSLSIQCCETVAA
ncbi:hypothetical protein ACOMHN_062872 [Nucella lapillus]